MKRSLIVAGFMALALLVVAAPGAIRAEHEPDLGAEAIQILAPFYQQGYWWDHTTLTVHIKAAGNVDPAKVAAVREAITIWNAAIAHRHGEGLVTLVDVSADPVAAARADLVVTVHAQAGALFGMARCNSGQQCQVLLWDLDRADARSIFTYWCGGCDFPLSYEEMVSSAVHELGHALGLGHAVPLFGTLDVMGYGMGTAEVLFPPAVISECDMAAFDVVWAWAIDGTEPAPPTASRVDCA